MKKYFRACWAAISADWFDFVRNDSAFGNGFQIMAYGLKLIGFYLMSFTVRLLFALLFPITAFIVLRMKRYEKRLEANAKADL